MRWPRAQWWLALAAGLYSLGETLAVLHWRLLPRLWAALPAALPSLGRHGEIAHTVAFVLVLSLFGMATSLPWRIYATFALEQRHGFNKQTPRLFATDLAKSLLLGAALLPPVVSAATAILMRAGPWMPLQLYALVLGLSLFFMIAYPIGACAWWCWLNTIGTTSLSPCCMLSFQRNSKDDASSRANTCSCCHRMPAMTHRRKLSACAHSRLRVRLSAAIAPLFNKFQPLPPGGLRQQIERLAASLGFGLSALYQVGSQRHACAAYRQAGRRCRTNEGASCVQACACCMCPRAAQVDGSSRSAHSNAYMYGFYKWKRIVLVRVRRISTGAATLHALAAAAAALRPRASGSTAAASSNARHAAAAPLLLPRACTQYDTLLEQCSDEQVVAVLAHGEAGGTPPHACRRCAQVLHACMHSRICP